MMMRTAKIVTVFPAVEITDIAFLISEALLPQAFHEIFEVTFV